MSNIDEIKSLLMKESSLVKSKNLSEEDISKFIEEYHEAVNKILLDYGFVQISDDLRLEVVSLKKRNHVLRGKPYHNWRKYKIKAKISWDFYERIAKVFDELLGSDESGE